MAVVFMGGIGGAGMSTLAFYLLDKGYTVIGYDREESKITRNLSRQGAHITHDLKEALEWMAKAEEFVYTPALPDDHPLIIGAKKLGKRVYRRGEYLGKLLSKKTVIAVAGTHGKSTTTTLILHFLKSLGTDACGLIGAVPIGSLTGGYVAGSEPVVVEADEYDKAFLHLRPSIAVITSLDHEHVDQYPSVEDLVNAFCSFIARVTDCVVIDYQLVKRYPRIKVALEQSKARVKLVFWHALGADNHPDRLLSGDCEVIIAGKYRLVRKPLRLPEFMFRWRNMELITSHPGEHFAKNVALALAAVEAFTGSNLDPQRIIDSLRAFKGIERRFQLLYGDYFRGLVLDYAHHPAEVEAVLKAARLYWPDEDITVVFQPHLFSRTKAFAKEFGEALSKHARYIILTDIYPAREPPVEGVSSNLIKENITGCWCKLARLEEVPDVVASLRPRVVLLLGAGSINNVAEAVQNELMKLWFRHRNRQTLNGLKDKLARFGKVHEMEPLKHFSTLRIGGPARWICEPVDKEALIELLDYLEKSGVAWKILGRGSNLLIGDGPFHGVVVLTRQALNYLEIHDTQENGKALVRAGAGYNWMMLVSRTIQAGLKGLEACAGIPGSVGGALIMNAGAHGVEVFDWLKEIEVWDPSSRKVLLIKPSDIPHGYRYALFGGYVILEARFVLEKTDDTGMLKSIRKRLLEHRRNTQPIQQPNAGCIFKNFPDMPAGKLLDELGFKGMKEGSVYISEKHANFFVHDGNGSAIDMLGLIEKVRSEVYNRTGRLLQMEVKKFGNFDNEVVEFEVV